MPALIDAAHSDESAKGGKRCSIHLMDTLVLPSFKMIEGYYITYLFAGNIFLHHFIFILLNISLVTIVLYYGY